jgi:hypothetical protein
MSAVEHKFEEMVHVRNALAHFRGQKADDVDCLRRNATEVLSGVEKYIETAIKQTMPIDSNCVDDWYLNLKEALQWETRFFSYKVAQSNDGEWVKISLYSTNTFEMDGEDNVRGHRVDPVSVLERFPAIRKNVSYVYEQCDSLMYGGYNEWARKFSPSIVVHMVFGREMLAGHYEELNLELIALSKKLEREYLAAEQDKMMSGDIVARIYMDASSISYDDGHRPIAPGFFFTEAKNDVLDEFWPKGWLPEEVIDQGSYISDTPWFPWFASP